MTHTLATLLLALCCLAGLVLVPLGLPGLWVMVAGIVGYGWLTEFRSIGVATMAVVLRIAFLGEIIEAWVGFLFSRTFGRLPPGGSDWRRCRIAWHRWLWLMAPSRYWSF